MKWGAKGRYSRCVSGKSEKKSAVISPVHDALPQKHFDRPDPNAFKR
jgi:hypothetical protein